MGFLNTIRSIFRAEPDRRYRQVHARCARCGEVLSTRIDLYNELSVEYGDGRGKESYYCRKVLMGDSGCFNRVELEMSFDSQRRLMEVEAEGGEYLSAEEAEEEREKQE